MFLRVGTYYGVGDAIVIGSILSGLAKDNDIVQLIIEESNTDKQDWWDLIYTNSVDSSYENEQDVRNLFQGYEKNWHDLELNANNRHEAWAANVNTTPLKYTLNIPEASINYAADFLSTRTNCIILSPFTRSVIRQWPVASYQALATRLIDAGFHVLINPSTLMGSGNGCCGDFVPDTSAFAAFEPMPSDSPGDVCALIAMSSLVIGGDCGYCHIAGTLGKNAIALTSATHGEKVFGFYDTVKVVRVLDDCSHCYMPFKMPLAAYCQNGCPLLTEITVDTVYQIAYNAINNGSFSKDTVSQVGLLGLPS